MTHELQHYRLALTGISCASCVARIEKALQAVVAVQQININFAQRTATIMAHGLPSPDILITAVKNASYGAILVDGLEQEEQTRTQLGHAYYQQQICKTIVAAVVSATHANRRP